MRKGPTLRDHQGICDDWATRLGREARGTAPGAQLHVSVAYDVPCPPVPAPLVAGRALREVRRGEAMDLAQFSDGKKIRVQRVAQEARSFPVFPSFKQHLHSSGLPGLPGASFPTLFLGPVAAASIFSWGVPCCALSRPFWQQFWLIGQRPTLPSTMECRPPVWSGCSPLL